MWWLRRSSRLDRLFALVNCASCCTARSPAHPFLLDKSSNSADPVGCFAARRACIFVDICKRFVRISKWVCFFTLASCLASRSAHGRASARARERGFSNDLQRNSALIVALLHVIQTISAQIIAPVENIRRIRAEFGSQTRDPDSSIQ